MKKAKKKSLNLEFPLQINFQIVSNLEIKLVLENCQCPLHKILVYCL